MPCNSGYDDVRTVVVERDTPATLERLAKTEAMLCLIMGHFERTKQVVAFEADEVADAGVDDRDLNDWWDQHRAQDALRRKAEAEKRRNAEKRRAALSKLTLEERHILGV